PVQIAAGGEAPACSLQHHDAHIRATGNVLPDRRKPLHDIVVEGVVDMRPVQGDRGNAPCVRLEKNDVCCSAHVRHIRKTPNFVGWIGALCAMLRPSASTMRVSAGSMMPSSQMRAEA